MSADVDLLFEAETLLGFRIRVTRERWQLITTVKHPVMAGREQQVRAALEIPDEVRQSRSDPAVSCSTGPSTPSGGCVGRQTE